MTITLKQKDIAVEYGISKQSISDIVKAKEQWLKFKSGTSLAESKRARRATFENVEKAMKIWVENILARSDLDLNDSLLMEKVLLFAEEFEFYKKCGESGSVNMDEIPKFREQLQDIIKDYEPQDMFNCDETALYWMLEPSRTLAYSPVKRKKKSKDQVLLLVITNAIEDEKLLILFIYKYEMPRALRGINKFTLPMHIANQKILLLIDNAKCHEADNINKLSNIQIHFLPPNTTSIIQPLDQKILYSLKAQYKKILCSKKIAAYEKLIDQEGELRKTSIYNAILYISRAWNIVSSEIIKHSWTWSDILLPSFSSELLRGLSTFNKEEELEHELDQLIQWLPIMKSLSVHEFICIDDNINHEEVDIKEIVDVVLGKGLKNEPDDKDKSKEEISISEALNSTKILITFIKQSEW
ncbi:4915_t:CDS:2, partial [Ambispora gerdemannii]